MKTYHNKKYICEVFIEYDYQSTIPNEQFCSFDCDYLEHNKGGTGYRCAVFDKHLKREPDSQRDPYEAGAIPAGVIRCDQCRSFFYPAPDSMQEE